LLVASVITGLTYRPVPLLTPVKKGKTHNYVMSPAR
jgi:hypothetical protein